MFTKRRVITTGIALGLLAVIACTVVWWNTPTYCVPDAPLAEVERVGDARVHVNGILRASILEGLQKNDTVFLTTPGGHLATARALAETVSAIRIQDRCDSACATILVEYAHACIVPGTLVSINFHSVVLGQCTESGVTFVHDPVRTQAIVDRVVDPLRGKLAHLSTGNYWVSIPVEEFLEAYPDRECPTTEEWSA
jgi:hypothetical protein